MSVRMAVIETKMDDLKQQIRLSDKASDLKMEDLKAAAEATRLSNNKKFDAILSKLDALDKKYASKWVETAIVTVIASIIVAIVLAFLKYGGSFL